jgi:Protein of unknown function (DUF3341)
MKNQLTLLYFENPEDLLAGIRTLQQYNIIIREIYASESVPNIENKLRIKQLQLGEMVFKFGCLGSIGLTSLVYYMLEPQMNYRMVLLNMLLLSAALFVVARLFSVKAPKVFALKPSDRRCFAVVDTQRIRVNESIAHFFQYTNAVELTPAIKNIVIS